MREGKKEKEMHPMFERARRREREVEGKSESGENRERCRGEREGLREEEREKRGE